MLKILQIGKYRNLVGGVVTHINSLSLRLKFKDDVINENVEPYLFNIFSIIHKIYINDIIHLHTTNYKLIYFISILANLFRKKFILTFHGNIINSKLYLFKLIKVDYIIVLNESSFFKLKKYRNVIYYSSYIKNCKIDISLNEKESILVSYLNNLKKDNIIICHTYTNLNTSIYGIDDLIEIFNNLPNNYHLLISDPYNKLSYYSFNDSKIKIITFPHNLTNIFQHIDCYIRNTNTDGDAIAIYEALDARKIVLATSIVNRPRGTYTYNSYKELIEYLENFSILKISEIQYDTFNNIYNLYKKLI